MEENTNVGITFLIRGFYVSDRLGGLVVIAPARRAGDPGSNPGPGENFFLKLLIYVYDYYDDDHAAADDDDDGIIPK